MESEGEDELADEECLKGSVSRLPFPVFRLSWITLASA